MPLNIIIGDIFEMSVDAIVVPIGMCGQNMSEFSRRLYEMAGYNELMSERLKIGHLPCGKSAVTSGYNLNILYIRLSQSGRITYTMRPKRFPNAILLP